MNARLTDAGGFQFVVVIAVFGAPLVWALVVIAMVR